MNEEIEKENYCGSSDRFILLSAFTGRILFIFILCPFTKNTFGKHQVQNCLMEKCNDYFLAELKMRS
ncbi:Quinone oxidoreductase-like protein [Trichinella pseudospiralis]